MKLVETYPSVVVLGGGESGVGAAILAKDRGHRVFLSDGGTLLPAYAAQLEADASPLKPVDTRWTVCLRPPF